MGIVFPSLFPLFLAAGNLWGSSCTDVSLQLSFRVCCPSALSVSCAGQGTPLSPHREDIFRKDYSQRSDLQVSGTNSSTDFWRQRSLTHSRAVMEALSARHSSGPNGTSLLNLPKGSYGARVCCPRFTDDNAAAERRSSLLGQGHAASKSKSLVVKR